MKTYETFQNGDKIKISYPTGFSLEGTFHWEDVEPYVAISYYGVPAKISLIRHFAYCLVEKIEPSQREKLNNTESIS